MQGEGGLTTLVLLVLVLLVLLLVLLALLVVGLVAVGLVAVGLAAIGWTSTVGDGLRLRGHLLGLGDDFVEGERTTARGAAAGFALLGLVEREAVEEGVGSGGNFARGERSDGLGWEEGDEVEGDAFEEGDGISVVFEFRVKVRQHQSCQIGLDGGV